MFLEQNANVIIFDVNYESMTEIVEEGRESQRQG